jgi:hypothetical protein
MRIAEFKSGQANLPEPRKLKAPLAQKGSTDGF